MVNIRSRWLISGLSAQSGNRTRADIVRCARSNHGGDPPNTKYEESAPGLAKEVKMPSPAEVRATVAAIFEIVEEDLAAGRRPPRWASFREGPVVRTRLPPAGESGANLFELEEFDRAIPLRGSRTSGKCRLVSRSREGRERCRRAAAAITRSPAANWSPRAPIYAF